MAGSRDHRPTWQLLLDAGRGLTARGTTEFTRAELIAAVQLMDPDRDPSSIGPILQGMTANAPGGPRSACGEVFRRVDRGVYTLVSPGGARARRSTRAGGAAGPAVSTWPARPGSAAADVPGGRVSGPTRVERSWGPLPGRRAGPSSKRSRIEARLEMLVAGFDGYVADYDRRVPFTRSGQYELHRATIDRRRAHGTLAHALADDRFVRLLHDTLRAWGIGKRGSRLVPVPELAAALRAHSAPLVGARRARAREAGSHGGARRDRGLGVDPNAPDRRQRVAGGAGHQDPPPPPSGPRASDGSGLYRTLLRVDRPPGAPASGLPGRVAGPRSRGGEDLPEPSRREGMADQRGEGGRQRRRGVRDAVKPDP